MRRPLGDGGAVALAGACAGGAWCAAPVPVLPAAAGVGLALLLRRPWLLVLAAGLLAAGLAASASHGMVAPPPGQVDTTVRLLTDPQPVFGGVGAEARLGERHVSLVADGGAASALANGLAGQRFHIRGQLGPLPASLGYLRVRHVVARVRVRQASFVDAGGPLWRAANRSRSLVESVVAPLPKEQQALFDGFVLGDSRGQGAELTADFRGSGLTHLLVVSGENVAFVLALASPLLRRLELRGRWAATVGVIVFFAAMTRFEPSVLRASVMAGLAATAALLGRPASSRRLLSLAVALLVLADPFLVHSVGFLLSVGATAAIVVAARPLAAALPGPAPLRMGAAVTLAAELGVAPLAAAVFGGVPVAALPANLLAVPAAGLVVVWGLPLGAVGGVLRALRVPAAMGISRVLLVPTSLLLRWVASVARNAAALPLGDLHTPGLVLLALGLAALVASARFPRAGLRWAGLGVVLVALVLPACAARVGVPVRTTAAPNVELYRRGGATVVVLTGAAAPTTALQGLRRAGVRRITLVVAGTGGARDASVVAALRHRWPVDRVLAPDAARIRDVGVPTLGEGWRVGGLVVTVTAAHPHLRVSVGAARPRSPPRGPV